MNDAAFDDSCLPPSERAAEPPGLEAITALVGLIRDAKACERRLQEFEKHRRQANEAIAEASRVLGEMNRRQRELDDRERNLKAREQAIASRESSFESKFADLQRVRTHLEGGGLLA